MKTDICIKCKKENYRILEDDRYVEVKIGIPVLKRQDAIEPKFILPRNKSITLNDGCLAFPVFEGAEQIDYVSDIYGDVTFYDPVHYSYPIRRVNIKNDVVIQNPRRLHPN